MFYLLWVHVNVTAQSRAQSTLYSYDVASRASRVDIQLLLLLNNFTYMYIGMCSSSRGKFRGVGRNFSRGGGRFKCYFLKRLFLH